MFKLQPLWAAHEQTEFWCSGSSEDIDLWALKENTLEVNEAPKQHGPIQVRHLWGHCETIADFLFPSLFCRWEIKWEPVYPWNKAKCLSQVWREEATYLATYFYSHSYQPHIFFFLINVEPNTTFVIGFSRLLIQRLRWRDPSNGYTKCTLILSSLRVTWMTLSWINHHTQQTEIRHI